MKKVLSILVLVVFLFNTGGYYIFFWGLHLSASARLARALDHGNYSSDEIYEFRIPLSIPYPIQDNGFDRAYGDFEYGGEYFTLVKQKLERDTLIVVCIRNHKKRQLARAFTEYANVSNDTGNATSKAGNELLNKLFKDFSCAGLPEIIHCDGWCREMNFSGMILAVIQMEREVISPPPNLLFC